MTERLDLPSLVGGIAVTVLGVLLLLDQVDAIELTIGWLAVAICATVGAVLLTSGMPGSERRPSP